MSTKVAAGLSLDNVQLVEIKPNMMKMFWGRIHPILQPAVDRNETLRIEHVYYLVVADLFKLYAIVDDYGKIFAAFAIEKVSGMSEKYIRVVLAAGEPMKAWIHKLIEKVDDLCIEYQCSFYELIGRPGWKRVLKEIGYESDMIFRRKVK